MIESPIDKFSNWYMQVIATYILDWYSNKACNKPYVNFIVEKTIGVWLIHEKLWWAQSTNFQRAQN